MDDIHTEAFDNVAPILNVASIASYLDPNLVDSNTIEAIAERTGTPTDLVESMVEAVSEVKDLLSQENTDKQAVQQQFSRFVKQLGRELGRVPERRHFSNPVATAEILHAVSTDCIQNFSHDSPIVKDFSNSLGENKELVISSLNAMHKNYARTVNFANPRVIKKAVQGTQALNKMVKEAANKSAAEAAVKKIDNLAKTNSEVQKVVTDVIKENAPRVYGEAGKDIVKQLESVVKDAKPGDVVNAVKNATGDYLKAFKQNILGVGVSADLWNFKDLVNLKLLSKDSAKLLESTGVRGETLADALKNGNLAMEITKDIEKQLLDLRTMTAKIEKAAREGAMFPEGCLPPETIQKLEKQLNKQLSANNKFIEKKVLPEAKRLQDVLNNRQEAYQQLSNLLAESGETSSKAIEKILPKDYVKSASGKKLLEQLKRAESVEEQQKVVRSIREDLSKSNQALSDSIKQCQSLSYETTKVADEAATATKEVQAGVQRTVEPSADEIMANLDKMSNEQRAALNKYMFKDVTSTAATEAAQKDIEEAKVVAKGIKEKLASAGKKALVGTALVGVPSALIWAGTGSEDDFLGQRLFLYDIDQAEKLRVQVQDLENQIKQQQNELVRENEELVAMSQSAEQKNFSAGSILKSLAKGTLTVSAVAASGAATVYGVAAVRDKILRIKAREKELANTVKMYRIKKSELNHTLHRMNTAAKRFQYGYDYTLPELANAR
ncbi:MAG: hypothetical protein MJZ34_02790 [Paludibacteraceae bacterium]|nr:hypothetical protein [Paludibacteraceae bacterium]